MDFSVASDYSDKDSPGLPGDFGVNKKIPKELTSHGTTPSGKPRLFVCQTCTRAFARLEHLRRHERSHTKEKPFTCGVCQRKFSRRDLLLRHAQKLHAGCADAITRLRRKSIKSGSIGLLQDMYTDSLIAQGYRDSIELTPGTSKRLSLAEPLVGTPLTPHRGSMDSVQFNLNLFGKQKDLDTPGSRMLRSNSIKDQLLQRQLMDRKRQYRNRAASFSAQSGANYATAAVPELQESYPGANNVEFSTPQLIPTGSHDDSSWLTNLSTIPGLEGFKGNTARQDSIASLSLDHDGKSNLHSLGAGLLRSDSITSSGSSFNPLDAAANPPFNVPLNRSDSVTKPNRLSLAHSSNGIDNHDYGYSFYDIPENMLSKSLSLSLKIQQPLSPIKQEVDADFMDLENTNMINGNDVDLIPASITNGVSFDMNFLNDIDELTQDFNVGSKFLPNGYLFYGDNPLVSSSGIESSSPHAMMLPGNSSVPKSFQFQNQTPGGYSDEPSDKSYNTTRLFTTNIRHMISRSLSKYPISGIMTPSIPSNEKLEFYLSNFVNLFLSHFPFMHPSKLNESEMIKMTSAENSKNESARVCLPLLVATIGALLSKNKNDSEHLYEASRRTIHIHLESRKNQNQDTKPGGLQGQGANPLWLIQSLTLSVIYGLFSDNENNVYIVIRQLNALNSLVKTSIKTNQAILSAIVEVEDTDPNDEAAQTALFLKFIETQSETRIIFMIYKLTNFILMMYNVPLTLSVNDFGKLTCPNTYDEFVWNFRSYNDFKQYMISKNQSPSLVTYLRNSGANKIAFKDLLLRLTKNEFNPALVTTLSNLSKFGFSALVHGIYEIKQYEEMKYIDVYAIFDNITMFIDNARSNLATRIAPTIASEYEKLDYALLVCYAKICASVDFKFVKEQSWLRNYEELTKNYHGFLTTMENTDDFTLLKVIDCCIVILKLVLFKTSDGEEPDNENGASKIFDSEFSLLANGASGGAAGQLVADAMQHQYNTSANFEKLINWRVYDEIDISKNSYHSQMLFHVFTILSTFSICIAKRNNPLTGLGGRANTNNTRLFNQRFIIVLLLLGKIEKFLKSALQNSDHDSDLANLYLFSSHYSTESASGQPGEADSQQMRELLGLAESFSYNLDKSLYVLRIGELILQFLYDSNIKVCIFKKLSVSLAQIRKYLIDDEARILLH